MGKIKIGVYGSLRKGEYNYNRFKEYYKDGVKVLSEGLTIEGFKLFDLGPYPAIERGEGQLTIDVLELSKEAYNSIRAMELGAGYDEDLVVVPNIGELAIYTYPEGTLTESPIVTSGDWSNYLKTK